MKKSRLKSKTATALYVVLHAKWQQSRGRKPSMTYGRERNPVRALEIATKQLSKEIETAVNCLKCLRNPNDKSTMTVRTLRGYAKSVGLSPNDFGSSEWELDDLVRRGRDQEYGRPAQRFEGVDAS